MGRYDYHTIESWEISYLLSLIFIRYPEIAEQKIAETKRPARAFLLYNQPADIPIRPTSAVFGIEEPLSILILFNMEGLVIEYWVPNTALTRKNDPPERPPPSQPVISPVLSAVKSTPFYVLGRYVHIGYALEHYLQVRTCFCSFLKIFFSQRTRRSVWNVCRFLNGYRNEDKATYKMDARWSWQTMSEIFSEFGFFPPFCLQFKGARSFNWLY